MILTWERNYHLKIIIIYKRDVMLTEPVEAGIIKRMANICLSVLVLHDSIVMLLNCMKSCSAAIYAPIK